MRVALGLMGIAGVLLPLFGASLVAVFALDRIVTALKRV
jgi:uncharacterized iron-regulated membrane protein